MGDVKMQAAKAALGNAGAFDNLGRVGPEGAAAVQAIKDRLRAMLLDDLACPNRYTADGEPVRSAAQLADSFGVDGRYERYDQVRAELREWLDCDLELGGELLEIVERHVGEITDDEGEREDIGRSLVDEAVVYAIGLIEQWASDEAAAAEADWYVTGMGAKFTTQPFVERAPAWLLERDSYARLVFDEACLRSAEAFSGGHGRLPDAARDLREWWETFVDYLFVAADSTLDGAETDAEREDAEAVQRLAEHFQAGFAAEFPAAPEPTFEAVAEAVADGRMTVGEAQRRMPSTSQRCLLALLAGEPGAAEPPYDDSAAKAWGRLDDRQRALVERLAPDVIARYALRR